MNLLGGYKKLSLALALSAGVLIQALPGLASGHAVSIGVVSPVPAGAIHRIHIGKTKHAVHASSKAKSKNSVQHSKTQKNLKASKLAARKKGKKAAPAGPPKPPQDVISALSQTTLAPGVVHKCHRGPLNINIVDVDLTNPNIEVKPILAGDTFNRLDEVRDQAQKVNAIAAVNANYFKKDGTPLGTLVIDGEWIAGPLYDRISFGLTDSGSVHVDRANLHGTVESSNPEVSSLWVNNINQPRRTGSKLVAYTRRWGASVKMAYAGCLVAVDSSGRVVDKTQQNIAIPYGGFVLSDTKKSPISKLNRGDLVFLEWHHRPDAWADVVQAVSGGPALIKNGKLYLDLKDENFRKTWTSSTIHARTALGITRNNHLILATVEGPHTLWDLAKMLNKLACVEAMNLDGGGSTTMVVHGKIVTRNRNTYQRRVAASLAVLPRTAKPSIASRRYGSYVPQTDLSSVTGTESIEKSIQEVPEVADPVANGIQEKVVLPVAEASRVQEPQKPLVVEMPEETSSKRGKKRKLGKALNFGWVKGIMGKD